MSGLPGWAEGSAAPAAPVRAALPASDMPKPEQDYKIAYYAPEPRAVAQVVDFDDYSLIDLAFNTQSGTLRPVRGSIGQGGAQRGGIALTD